MSLRPLAVTGVPGLHVVLVILLGLASAAAPLLTLPSSGVSTRDTGLSAFGLTALLHLLALGYTVWGTRPWLHPERRAGVRDFVVAGAPLAAAVVAYWLLRQGRIVFDVAGAHVPPLPDLLRVASDLYDFVYLGAVVSTLAVMVSTVVLLALLVRSRSHG